MQNPIPKDLIPDPLILNPSTLLLHCCCAGCAGGIITALMHSGITPTVLFYNPNIHPENEYLLRKAETVIFLNTHAVPFMDSDYDPQRWFEATTGLEHEPERGERCRVCFTFRLDHAARLARDNGFKVFTSTLGISRWKDIDQVNAAGQKAAEKYGVTYWDYNWRKKGGQDLIREVIRRENFYQQTYCGCQYSLNTSQNHPS